MGDHGWHHRDIRCWGRVGNQHGRSGYHGDGEPRDLGDLRVHGHHRHTGRYGGRGGNQHERCGYHDAGEPRDLGDLGVHGQDGHGWLHRNARGCGGIER